MLSASVLSFLFKDDGTQKIKLAKCPVRLNAKYIKKVFLNVQLFHLFDVTLTN